MNYYVFFYVIKEIPSYNIFIYITNSYYVNNNNNLKEY